MSNLSFVNINGVKVSTSPVRTKTKKAAGLKRVNDAARATHHFGFEIVGVSQCAIDLALELARQNKKSFDQQAFLNGAKPTRALKRIYYVPDAAEAALQILEKTGVWFCLRVQPIFKG